MRESGRRRLTLLLMTAAAAMMIAPQLDAVAKLPEAISVTPGRGHGLPVTPALEASLTGDGHDAAEITEAAGGGLELYTGTRGESTLTYRLLGLPVRKVAVRSDAQRRLIPGGQSVGVAIDTRGVIVVGASDLGSVPSPARLAGLKNGDIIQRVNGVDVNSAEALAGTICSGDAVQLEILRKGEARSCTVVPAMDARDGSWRLGAWVRDSTAGIGTLTFVDPATGRFGALGHAVTDADTRVLRPVGEGELYANRVVDVSPSACGRPGELTGDFVFQPQAIGSVERNTDQGIFGTLDGESGAYAASDGLVAARRDEIHAGPASLLTTLDESGVREYACEIERVNDRGDGERAMVLKITDSELLARTGGIVQGMSGSPVLQDGKLVGAITHVMVNDPQRGYGICIEDMQEQADALDASAEAA